MPAGSAGPDNCGMDGADKHDVGTEELRAEPATERPPASQRLENALGGEFSRFLVTALASHSSPNGNAS